MRIRERGTCGQLKPAQAPFLGAAAAISPAFQAKAIENAAK